MYSNYNIPQYNPNMQRNSYYNSYSSNDDRFFGGFAGPFILGGIAGSLLTPRNNYPIYQPGPPLPPPYYPQPYYPCYRPPFYRSSSSNY